MTSPYKNQAIKPRGKGRFDPMYLAYRFGGPAIPEGSSMEVVGSFVGFDEHGKSITYEAIEVTLASGIVVPAYRRGEGWNICQNLAFKAAK